jgi:hypothetical protein
MSIQEVKMEGQSDKKREGRQWARQELVQSVNRAIKEVNYINNIYGLFNNIDEITNYTRAEALLEDIKSLEFEKYFGMDPGEPSGMCFVIKYQDEAYDIISYYEPMQVVWVGPNEHFPNRQQTGLFFWLKCDYDVFNGLINKYMKTVDGGLS